jgi:mannan endo-1,4-beta-mannosidase
VLFEAGKRGIRLLLALSNNWDAYGGAPAYITWAAAAGEPLAPVAPDASPFFTSPFCKDAYKAFVRTLLTRVNTYSGVAYRDDPTIFAFNLMNEPRVPADPSGDTLHVRRLRCACMPACACACACASMTL